MTFSIITPTFNSAATLSDTCRSIRSQLGVAVEHLVQDGGSKDHTIAIAQDFEAHCRSEPDQGLYHAMNKGIQRATGDIIGILNSDDFYADDQVLARVQEAFSDPEVQAVYGNLDYVDPVDTGKVIRKWRSGRYHHSRFRYGWMPPHPTFFVRRALYERYGDFDLSFRTSADYELMLRFLYKHRVQAVHIPEVLVKMRAGGVSNSSFRHRLRANREDRRAWEVNGLKPHFFTTWLKPVRKLGQWI